MKYAAEMGQERTLDVWRTFHKHLSVRLIKYEFFVRREKRLNAYHKLRFNYGLKNGLHKN